MKFNLKHLWSTTRRVHKNKLLTRKGVRHDIIQ